MSRAVALLWFALSLVVSGLTAQPASAFLIGAPTFTTVPTSALGPITLNTLTVTPFPNGFSVAGQIQVTIPSTAASTPLTGVLLSYEVDYPVDPTFPFNPTLFTTTAVDGFSTPPPGTVGNTAGFVHSVITALPNTPLVASISNVPLALVAGFDFPQWSPPIVGNSGIFPFAGAPNMVLRQTFMLDGSYLAGPGGIWTIDLPANTYVTLVPEPASGLLFLTGFCTVAARRNRSRQRTHE